MILIDKKPLMRQILEKEEEMRKIWLDLSLRKGDDDIDTIVAKTRLLERIHCRRMIQTAKKVEKSK